MADYAIVSYSWRAYDVVKLVPNEEALITKAKVAIRKSIFEMYGKPHGFKASDMEIYMDDMKVDEIDLNAKPVWI